MFGGVYRGKKVFVTGHTGFKGSWLCEWLLELGAEVTGYSDRVPTTPAYFESARLDQRMRDVRGDVRDFEALQRAMKSAQPELVFHLAAQPLVRDSYDDPKGTIDTNVGGTVNVLECVRRLDSVSAAVSVATDKCYENQERAEGYRETDPLGGKDPYSGSKGAAEIIFAAYARSFFNGRGKRVASARAGNVIGPHDWAKDRIVPDCVRSWSAGSPVVIRSPSSTRPWQHVLEPLSGYLALGAALWEDLPAAVGQSFNFGPGDDADRTVEELLRELRKSWPGADWRVDSSLTEGKAEAKLLKLCCEKAKDRLHWVPTLSFAESVRMTAEGYRAEDFSALGQIRSYSLLARERGCAWARDGS